MTADFEDNLDARPALQQVLHYHEITKHHFQSYAQGPGSLDWATQPKPFRRYQGARLVSLEKFPATDEPLYDDAFVRGRIPAAPVTFQTISQLFYDSLAISAWKSTGEHSWALRVNPSSGNLHPTEGYLICGPIDGLGDRPMVCHYAPKEHGLEVRAEFERGMWDALWLVAPADIFLVGLTSIHWREAWKYGQRAYRYCQHDVGHAIGAIVIAAAGLGWQTQVLDDLGTEELALLMGTGNDDAESEEPDVLMAVGPHAEEAMGLEEDQIQALRSLTWQGTANQLSPSHLDWGVETTAAAARKPRSRQPYERRESPQPSCSYDHRSVSLRTVVRQRRSAVAMDRKTHITRDTFYRILQRTLAVPGSIPLSTLPWTPHIHLAIFVHRVKDLPAGLYLFVRDASQTRALRAAFTKVAQWQRPAECESPLRVGSGGASSASTAEEQHRDQRRVEAIGATRDHPQLVVDAPDRSSSSCPYARMACFRIVRPSFHGVRRDRRPLQPLIEQRRRILWCRLPQDRRQVLLQFVRSSARSYDATSPDAGPHQASAAPGASATHSASP